MLFASQRGSVRGLIALVLATACTAIDYADGGGSASGGSDAGAGPSVGGSGVGGSANVGAGSSVGGQGGAPPCQPGAAELCNGVDDDCDGIADNPPGGVGTVCPEMTWETAPDGRLYVSIPLEGADVATHACPTGTELVVLQSQQELSFLEVFVPLEGDMAVLGAQQEPQRSHRVEGWSWVRPGIPMPWSAGEPDDYRPNEPAMFENDDENCAGLYHGPMGSSFADLPCNGGTSGVFVCEQIGDGGVPGGACLLDEGCAGTWDTAGTTCNPVPQAETCNGHDDACDGMADEDATCGCVMLTDPSTGRSYKNCALQVAAQETHCGTGYRLAIVDSAAENTYLISQLGGGGQQSHFVGLLQPLDSVDVLLGFEWLDGTPVVVPWAPGQPSDFPTTGEQGEQNCGVMSSTGLRDQTCSANFKYFCEQWP